MISAWSVSRWEEARLARYLGKYGSKDVSKAVIISGAPPFLPQDGRQPGGYGWQRLCWDRESGGR